MDRIGPTAVLHKYQDNLSGFYPKHTFRSHLKNKKNRKCELYMLIMAYSKFSEYENNMDYFQTEKQLQYNFEFFLHFETSFILKFKQIPSLNSSSSLHTFFFLVTVIFIFNNFSIICPVSLINFH